MVAKAHQVYLAEWYGVENAQKVGLAGVCLLNLETEARAGDFKGQEPPDATASQKVSGIYCVRWT